MISNHYYVTLTIQFNVSHLFTVLAAEYTNCTFGEVEDTQLTSVSDMTQNNLMVWFE